MEHRVAFKIGEEELVLETGKMAKQANGAVFGRLGGSAVIATACCASNEKEDLDFIPLSVDYLEKYYAAGKIPGGFIKREGRPKDKEVLVSRLIDRPIRPLFSKLFRREIQVIPMAISTDQVNPPDILAMNAASAAITISDIPFEGPIGAVRMGYVNGALVVNPTFDQIQESMIDLVVAGTAKGHHDGGGRRPAGSGEPHHRGHRDGARHHPRAVPDPERAGAEGRQDEASPDREAVDASPSETRCRPWAKAKLGRACFVKGKEERSKAIRAVRDEAQAAFADRLAETDIRPFKALFEDMEQEIMRNSIVEKGRRTDGRGPDGHPAHHLRDRRPSPDPRLGPLHARRDPGAGRHDPRHRARRADHGQHRRGQQEELHAALQLPAVLRRGDGTPGLPGAPRDRPRAPRRARHREGAARQGELPLHGPHRLGDPRIQRLLLHGHGVRKHPEPPQRGRPHREARCGHRDGPREGRETSSSS